MKIYSTDLPEVKIIEYEKKTDNRGFSHLIYNRTEMENAGIIFEYKEELFFAIPKCNNVQRKSVTP